MGEQTSPLHLSSIPDHLLLVDGTRSPYRSDQYPISNIQYPKLNVPFFIVILNMIKISIGFFISGYQIKISIKEGGD